MVQTNANCPGCKGQGTVIIEISSRLELDSPPEPIVRAVCTLCHRASRWIDQEAWHGLAFHSRQMKKPEGSPEAEQPTDLIGIAAAARLVGKHPNTISTRINLGDIPSYKPQWPGTHPKKRQRLVSRAEILAIYKMADTSLAAAPTRALELEAEEPPERPASPPAEWVPCACGTWLGRCTFDGQDYAAYSQRDLDRSLTAGLSKAAPLHDIYMAVDARSASLIKQGLCTPESDRRPTIELPGYGYTIARGNATAGANRPRKADKTGGL